MDVSNNTMMLKIFLPAVIVAFFSACTWNNEEELYKTPTACDTSNITYSGTIRPILDEYCENCHKVSNASGGVRVDTYQNLLIIVNDGSFYGSINYAPGYSPMPPNGNKLSDCALKKIKAWIDAGAPNN